ncbi:uncharacterized protein An08g11400 [Aspergillus niger]|uniref:Contig An08c0280, genomic contig n=2 Tax=Aspergillus niger TaxID=5061 RepID=A2QSN9_ASPNC|nr:uncharacterized protein An08g11400 [Aspergillus niger]CAK45811.1 unnamed protein product [Aspergillus niger]
MSNVLSSPLQKARAIKDATVCVRRMGTSRKFGGDMFSPSRNSRQNVASDVLFQVIKKRHDKPDVAKGKMIVEILFRTPTATCTYFLRGPLQAVHPTH